MAKRREYPENKSIVARQEALLRALGDVLVRK
jgi:hypothetical protein